MSHPAAAGGALLRRACVACPPSPACPVCAADETCSLSSQTCTACAQVSCVKLSTAAAPAAAPARSSGSSTPAIAASLAAAVLAVLLLGILFFLLRRRRRRRPTSVSEKQQQESYNPLQCHARRSSQHTIASIASSALTRASNIIPIAYIPTGRSTPNPASLPPRSGPNTPLAKHGDQFFSADELLRASYVSSAHSSSAGDRTSVATTAYRATAIISRASPMQTAVRAKPSLVNVKASPSLATVPPVPKMPPLPDLGFEERSRFSLGSVLRASRDIKLDIPSPAVFGLGLHSGPQSSTSRDDQTHSPFSDNQSSTFTFPAPPNSSPFADEHRISASDSKQEP